jgi:hypothetical protein
VVTCLSFSKNSLGVTKLTSEETHEEQTGYFLVEVIERFAVRVSRRMIREGLDMEGNMTVTVQDLTDFINDDEEALLEHASNEYVTREIEWRLLLT